MVICPNTVIRKLRISQPLSMVATWFLHLYPYFQTRRIRLWWHLSSQMFTFGRIENGLKFLLQNSVYHKMGVVTRKGCSDRAKILYACSVSQIATLHRLIQKLKKVAWFWYTLGLVTRHKIRRFIKDLFFVILTAIIQRVNTLLTSVISKVLTQVHVRLKFGPKYQDMGFLFGTMLIYTI